MNSAYPLQTYIERFFTERLLAQSHATPNTVATYRDAFLLLIRFAAEQTGRNPAELGVKHVDANLVKCFLTYCQKERGNSARSNNTRLSAIRSFFRFVGDSEPQLDPHCQEVVKIRIKREYESHDARYLTVEEMKALVDAPDCSSWRGRRDRTLMLLMLHTGLRASEATHLRLRDVELGTGAHVRCTGKGGEERVILLPPDSKQALQSWVAERKAEFDDLLFMSTHGKALNKNAVQRLVLKHTKKASEKCPSLEKKRVTPLVLRHTAARQLLRKSNDPAKVARWLGRKSATRNELDANAKVELKEGAKAQTHLTESGYGQSVQKDGLVDFLETL